MNEDCLKLTAYFGERDRVGHRFLADAFIDVFERHGLATSLVMRGVEGFGIKQHLRTDRLLTLSEDLPLVTVAVDARGRIEAALEEIRALSFDGLVTVERARLVAGAGPAGSGVAGYGAAGFGAAGAGAFAVPFAVPPDLAAAGKLTVYIGRHQRSGGVPLYVAVVGRLRQLGFHGATVLLGIDGTSHGVRRRASFFGRNVAVPLMVIAVGDGEHLGLAVDGLSELIQRPLLTLERVTVLKRDGRALAPLPPVPASDPSGLGIWQKLMVYAGEQADHNGLPIHHQLVRRLRTAGASGATTLRGVWGFDGDREPHGDRFWQLRRPVPAVTVIVDSPAQIARWLQLADELTDEAGVITVETVPAFRVTGPSLERGGLRLAARSPD